MRVGTLIMLKIPSGFRFPQEDAPVDGAFGEIMQPTLEELVFMEKDFFSVYFPRYPFNGASPNWQTHKRYLIPLSDPDADITETEDAPVEETV